MAKGKSEFQRELHREGKDGDKSLLLIYLQGKTFGLIKAMQN